MISQKHSSAISGHLLDIFSSMVCTGDSLFFSYEENTRQETSGSNYNVDILIGQGKQKKLTTEQQKFKRPIKDCSLGTWILFANHLGMVSRLTY